LSHYPFGLLRINGVADENHHFKGFRALANALI